MSVYVMKQNDSKMLSKTEDEKNIISEKDL